MANSLQELHDNRLDTQKNETDQDRLAYLIGQHVTAGLAGLHLVTSDHQQQFTNQQVIEIHNLNDSISILRQELGGIVEAIKQITINVPDIHIPEIKVPDITIPEIKMPEITVPEVKMPEIVVNVPEIKVPTIVIPTISVPEPKVTVTVAAPIIPPIKVPKAEVIVRLPEPKEVEPVKGEVKPEVTQLKMFKDKVGNVTGMQEEYSDGSKKIISGLATGDIRITHG